MLFIYQVNNSTSANPDVPVLFDFYNLSVFIIISNGFSILSQNLNYPVACSLFLLFSVKFRYLLNSLNKSFFHNFVINKEFKYSTFAEYC